MSASFLSASDRGTLEALSRITYCNPFLPERQKLEQEILGRDFREPDTSSRDLRSFSTNLDRLHEVALHHAENARLAFYQVQGR
jgi:hypothetical protein